METPWRRLTREQKDFLFESRATVSAVHDHQGRDEKVNSTQIQNENDGLSLFDRDLFKSKSRPNNLVYNNPQRDAIQHANMIAWLEETKGTQRIQPYVMPQTTGNFNIKPSIEVKPKLAPIVLDGEAAGWAETVHKSLSYLLQNVDSAKMWSGFATEMCAYGVRNSMPGMADIFSNLEYLLTDCKLGRFGDNEQFIGNDLHFVENFGTAVLRLCQKRLVEKIMNKIEANLNLAMRGAEPGLDNDIVAFLNVTRHRQNDRLAKLDEYKNQPMWAVVYYCLLCGAFKIALNIMNKCSEEIKSITSVFEEILAAVTALNDGVSLNETIRTTLVSHLKTTRDKGENTDVYLRATLAFLLPADQVDNDYLEIATSWPIFLNHKLRHAMAINSLADLQHDITETYGQEYFCNTRNHGSPQLYANMLLLSGQLSKCLAYLAETNQSCSAIHLALIFHAAHLLDTCSNIASLDYDIATTVHSFVNTFVMKELELALDYIFIIGDIPSSDIEMSIFDAFLLKMITCGASIDALLGSVDQSNVFQPGLVKKYKIDAQRCARFFAQKCLDHTSTHLAAHLFDIGGDVERALNLLVDLLVGVVRRRKNDERAETHATHLAKRVHAGYCDCRASTRYTLYRLLDLVTFIKHYNKGEYACCVDILIELKLVPLNSRQIETVEQELGMCGVQVRRALPYALTIYLDSLWEVNFGVVLNEVSKQQLYDQMDAILALAAMIGENLISWHAELLEKVNEFRKL